MGRPPPGQPPATMSIPEPPNPTCLIESGSVGSRGRRQGQVAGSIPRPGAFSPCATHRPRGTHQAKRQGNRAFFSTPQPPLPTMAREPCSAPSARLRHSHFTVYLDTPILTSAGLGRQTHSTLELSAGQSHSPTASRPDRLAAVPEPIVQLPRHRGQVPAGPARPPPRC